MTLARIAYEGCPLCGEKEFDRLARYNCSNHPLYKPSLPPLMKWCSCRACRHVFTDGYFGEEALAVLLSDVQERQQPGGDVETGRNRWAHVVERVAAIVPSAPQRGFEMQTAPGRWLDIGFGDGALLLTAQEWGFDVLGIDLRADNVDALNALGVPARCVALEQLDTPGGFDVVSMADVLEHMPFPGQALKHVHRLLAERGIVYVSMPNADSASWRALDREGKNPYWVEIEHYHNFTRDRLQTLLHDSGMAPVWYGVSNRYRCGMELIARRTGASH
jgi:SAM-dependent methyltransferase